ncbi:MAG: UbiA family prenyltransferase [Myxococcota bacterium]
MARRLPWPSAAAAEVASILRLHIVAIAVTAALAFSWLLTGALRPEVALLGGVDWLLINLLNRITDLKEDQANDIRGSDLVGRHPRVFTAAWIVLLVGSFTLGHAVLPDLTPWRVGVQIIGLGYSVPLVPTLKGLRRFKDLYFLKNFMSAVLFCLTGFAYPLVAAGGGPPDVPGGWAALAVLVGFFVPFELTYEILYDLRDLEGDRLAGVPTYPVVHGAERSRQIIDGLLLLSTLVLAVGLGAGVVGVREGLMLVAPLVQVAYYRPRFRRGLTRSDCIRVTWLGAGLLMFYLVGNLLWLAAGLPDNIFLR